MKRFVSHGQETAHFHSPCFSLHDSCQHPLLYSCPELSLSQLKSLTLHFICGYYGAPSPQNDSLAIILCHVIHYFLSLGLAFLDRHLLLLQCSLIHWTYDKPTFLIFDFDRHSLPTPLSLVEKLRHTDLHLLHYDPHFDSFFLNSIPTNPFLFPFPWDTTPTFSIQHNCR